MPDDRYCPACRRAAPEFLPARSRADARCPNCQSLERHRFLALLLDLLGPYLRTGVHRVLDVAPQRIIRLALQSRFPATRYVALDLAPDREVGVLGDLTALPFPDAAFDLVLCYHVLEHVPDDTSAIAELARVLSPGGLALVQVPRRLEQATDDGPLVGEQPARRFGQDDHVRWYGWDFEARLRSGGLEPTVIRPYEVVEDAAERRRLALDPREEVWLCRRASPDGAPIDQADALGRALLLPRWAEQRRLAEAEERARRASAEARHHREDLDRTRGDLERARASLERWMTEADRARASYRRLARHPVVRFLRAVRRLPRRVSARIGR